MDRFVLYVENDRLYFRDIAATLRDRHVYAAHACNGTDALRQATAPGAIERLLAVVLDLDIEAGDSPEIANEAKQGDMIGHVVARLIRRRDSKTPILAFSNYADIKPDIRRWFNDFSLDVRGCRGFYNKTAHHERESLFRCLEALAFPDRPIRAPFLVIHGHDHKSRDLLCAELRQQTCAEPIFLDIRDQPSKLILQQFEEQVVRAAGAFALLTEDDWGKKGATHDSLDPGQARARQNVILEVGYCFGKFGRQSGRIFLLKLGDPEVPSDLLGVPLYSLDEGIDRAVAGLRDAINKAC